VTSEGIPVGRLSAIQRRSDGVPETIPTPVDLAAGPLGVGLVVDGVPLDELAAGTALRIGAFAIVELIGAPPGSDRARRAAGLVEATAETSCAREARVREAGPVRVGDRVVLESVPVPLEDALDLHPFRPSEVTDVVRRYLGEAAGGGFAEVRLIHGRGRGVQREAVRRLLATLPIVLAFGDAPPERGGWGATMVRLRPGGGRARSL
jgi:hypothetical protein